MATWHGVVGVLAVIAGLWSTLVFFKSLRMVRALSYSATPVKATTAGTRPTIEGEIHPIDGTEPSAVTKTPETVLTFWMTRQWDKSGNRSNWVSEAGVHGTPFYVDDGTGRVYVDVGESDHEEPVVSLVSASGSSTVTDDGTIAEFEGTGDPLAVVDGDVTAAQLEEFERRMEITDVSDRTFFTPWETFVPFSISRHQHGEREYYEQVLEPGDTVCVCGEVTETDDGSLELTTPSDVPQIISELSASKTYLRALGGVGILLASIGLIVGGLHLLTLA